MNGIPEKLIDFRIYEDGTDLLGIADVKLPDIEYLTETVKGAGLAGEIESPAIGQLKSMSITFNWRTITKPLIGLAQVKQHHLDCRGVIQSYDAATGAYKAVPLKVVVRCLPKKIEAGKMEPAAKQDSSTEMECVYEKMTLDGEEILEVDKYNYICKINGHDEQADIRSALGL